MGFKIGGIKISLGDVISVATGGVALGPGLAAATRYALQVPHVPSIQPPPAGPDLAAEAAKAAQRRARIVQGQQGRQSTIMTSPRGLLGAAPAVTYKTLLGS